MGIFWKNTLTLEIKTDYSFLGLTYLITNIFFAESREEPRRHIDILPLRCAWAPTCCWILGGRLRNSGGKRPGQGFCWGSVCSWTEYFCWWWQCGVRNCHYGRAGWREFCFGEWPSSRGVQCVTLVIEFVLTNQLHTFHWRRKNNLWTRTHNLRLNLFICKCKINHLVSK